MKLGPCIKNEVTMHNKKGELFFLLHIIIEDLKTHCCRFLSTNVFQRITLNEKILKDLNSK